MRMIVITCLLAVSASFFCSIVSINKDDKKEELYFYLFLGYALNIILIFYSSSFFSSYEKILVHRKIILIDKYDREEADIEDNIAASKGLNPINNNSYRIIHRDTLLIISNIDHANIIFFIICFRILKLI